MEFVPIESVDADAVERLLDHAFGTDRRQRAAYRIRAGMAVLGALSFAAIDAGALAGTVQCWPISLALDTGGSAPLVMVGPIAVEPALQQRGLGRALTERALVAAESLGMAGALTLIGDPEYYGRFFGFSADRTGAWRVPGPVEPRRLLARGPAVPDGAGMLGPRLPETKLAILYGTDTDA